MIRKREAAGLALMAFGVGMILAVLLQSGLCPLIIGAAAVIAGCLLLK